MEPAAFRFEVSDCNFNKEIFNIELVSVSKSLYSEAAEKTPLIISFFYQTIQKLYRSI